MYIKVLPTEAKKVLALLVKNRILDRFYLAGGTGLALQLGHRLSKDLDFFSTQELRTGPFIKRLARIGKFSLYFEDKGTVTGSLKGARVSFFGYNHTLLYPLTEFMGFNTAHIIDIALMKINAISSRGSKKDFIDLYFVCKKVNPLNELLGLFAKKHKGVDYSLYHLLRSLTYFIDAEKEVPPQMIMPIDWEEVKKFFEAEVKEIEKILTA